MQRNTCTFLADQAESPEGAWALDVTCYQADKLLPPTGTCCQPWLGKLQAPSLGIRLQEKPIISLT